MDPVTYLAESFRSQIPAYPEASVEAVAKSLGEPVLWSGRKMLPADVASFTDALGVVATVSIACLVVAALCAGYVTWGSMRRRWMSSMSVAILSVAALILGIGGILGGGIAYGGGIYVRGAATTGYVITATRIVQVEADGDRTDVPASAITQVRRNAATGSYAISWGRGRELSIVAPASDRAALELAGERLLANAIKGSAPISGPSGPT